MFGEKNRWLNDRKTTLIERVECVFKSYKKEKQKIDKKFKKEIINTIKNCNSCAILKELAFGDFDMQYLYQSSEEEKQLQLQFLKGITQDKNYTGCYGSSLFDIIYVNSHLSEFCEKYGYELTKNLIDELFNTKISKKRKCITAIFNEKRIKNDNLKRKIIDTVLELENSYKISNISKLLEKEQYLDISNKFDVKRINNTIDNIVKAKSDSNDKAIGEILNTVSYVEIRTRLIKEIAMLENEKQIDYLVNIAPSFVKTQNDGIIHQSINMVYNIKNPELFDKIEKFISKTVLHIKDEKLQNYLFEELRTIKNGKSLEFLSDIIPVLMKYTNQNDTINTIFETIMNLEYYKKPKQFQIVYK